jgi:hypothetical protein
MTICPHFDRNPPVWNGKVLTHCRTSHWDNDLLNSTCNICSGLFQCRRCFTEFQIDSVDFRKKGSALVVTKWKDLGQGLTSMDPILISHLLDGVLKTKRARQGWLLKIESGSIRHDFEGGELDMDELLKAKDEESLLESPHFRQGGSQPDLRIKYDEVTNFSGRGTRFANHRPKSYRRKGCRSKKHRSKGTSFNKMLPASLHFTQTVANTKPMQNAPAKVDRSLLEGSFTKESIETTQPIPWAFLCIVCFICCSMIQTFIALA